MKFIIILLSVFTSYFSNAQQDGWVISATKIYLPGLRSDSESYRIANKNKVEHNYRHRASNNTKTTKLKGSSSIEAFEFIKNTMQDSIFSLPFETFNPDSLDLDFLTENNLIKDSMILVNFPLYSRQFHKLVPDTCALCLPIVRLHGFQIDGERLIITVDEDTTELFNLNIGYYESAMVNTLKKWIITAQLYHEFHLFLDLNLADYFSKEKITTELQEYIKALKK